jgi:hypothetical protein
MAEPAHGLRGLPASTACGARARTRAFTALRACVAAWPAAALPWLRWGARASMVEGPPTEQVGEGGRSPELFGDGKGGKQGRWQRLLRQWHGAPAR